MTKAKNLASLLDNNGDVVSSALDNVPAADLVNDTSPQLAANLDTNGNDIIFPDNARATFGNAVGGDLSLHHDGSNSYIIDNGTGDLVINTNGNAISLNTNGGGEYGLRVLNNGEVNLYHDNALRIATTASGATISGDLLVDGADPEIVIQDTNDTGDAYIRFKNNSGTQRSFIQTAMTGNVMLFGTGTTERMRIDSSGNVGIGTAPAGGVQLDVRGTGVLQLVNTDTVQLLASNGGSTLKNVSNNPLIFGTNNTERMRIDSAGSVGISTSSPVGQSKLTVAGSLSVTSSDNDFAAGGQRTFMDFASGKARIGGVGGGGAGTTLGLYVATGYEAVSINSDGNVGIGGSPSERLHVRNTGGDVAVKIQGNTRTFNIQQNNYGLRFVDVDAGSAERLRIDSSGKTFVTNEGNVSDANNANLCVNHSASTRGINLHTTGTGGSDRITFQNDNGTVGTINTSGSSTSYGTSSDYRLKTAVTYDWDATTRLKQLKPARFEWIADADRTVDGFLAHEVQDIVPEAITGTKDGMRDEEYEVTPAVLDEDGNEVTPAVMGTRSVPDYQGIDQSKIVPLLVKTVIELEARIAALET